VHGSSHVMVENAVTRRPLLIPQVSEKGQSRELIATFHEKERDSRPIVPVAKDNSGTFMARHALT
jgi:hypothetical protein